MASKTVRWAGEREWRVFKPTVGEAHHTEARTVTKIYLGSRVAAADEAVVPEGGPTSSEIAARDALVALLGGGQGGYPR